MVTTSLNTITDVVEEGKLSEDLVVQALVSRKDLKEAATDFRSSLEARLRNIAVEKGEKLQRLRRKVTSI